MTLLFSCHEDDALGLAFLNALGHRTCRVDQTEAAIAGAAIALRREPAAAASESLYLGGFSRGARLAARMANDLSCAGLVLLGYPFYPKGQPQERASERLLADVMVPSLIIQGERDSHGNRQLIGVDGPSDRVTIAWLADGNHRFVPRAASGSSQAALIAEAVRLADVFMNAGG